MEQKELEAQLKCVTEDRDTKQAMLLDMESCVVDIYQNAKTLKEAKEKCEECIYNTAKDAFTK